MVALADELAESGQTEDGGSLAGLFSIVSELIADDDRQHCAPPREVLRFLMRRHGLTQSDLPEVGNQSVVSQILSGHRALNKRQVAALMVRSGARADAFIESGNTKTH